MRSPRSATASVACLLALIAISCSTAPKKSDTVIAVKTQAAGDSTTGDGYFRQGRFVLALQFFTQSLGEYTSIDDEEGIINSYNSIGKTYLAMGALDQAEDMFTRALARAQVWSPALVFVSTNNLGELYLRKGDASRALSSFEAALAMPEKSRADAQAAILYHNLGTAQKNLGDPVKALEYYKKSLDINMSKKLSAEAASDYYMIASVHSLQGTYDEAFKNAELALSFDKKVENSPGIAQDLYALGLIATRRKDTAAAFGYFQRSYLVYTTLGLAAEIRKVLAELIAAADSLGRTADAESYRKTLADMGTS